MQLASPIKDFLIEKNISQLYGVSADYYKRNFGIPHHNGIDIVVRDSKRGYGTPILAMHTGRIDKIIYDTPHRTKGNGIYLLDESGLFSTNYWHLSGFECTIGQLVHKGDVIGLMGNSGTVLPTPNKWNPYNGTHLHIGLLLHNTVNLLKGFVNPLPFLWSDSAHFPAHVKFHRDLWWRSQGDDVSYLQNILSLSAKEQTLDYEMYGYMGRKTIRDTKVYQTANSISPILGFVGVKTRAKLQEYLVGNFN